MPFDGWVEILDAGSLPSAAGDASPAPAKQ
jgi:hypothetical protein